MNSVVSGESVGIEQSAPVVNEARTSTLKRDLALICGGLTATGIVLGELAHTFKAKDIDGNPISRKNLYAFGILCAATALEVYMIGPGLETGSVHQQGYIHPTQLPSVLGAQTHA